MQSGKYQRVFTTGPTQSGKSMIAFVLPTLYYLFEMQETVICGLPDMNMADDKWNDDLLPAIEAGRYASLLPARGAGSKGGKIGAANPSVRFLNGATLRFMSGGGRDKTRAAKTSRVIVLTEVDGMDEPGTTSREADKITQIEARSDAYGARRRVYGECTVSTDQGRTWREYTKGTESRIMLPCPHCGSWVHPDREHFMGWQDAETVVEAMEQAHWTCPECGVAWSDDDRIEANQHGVLVHRGQNVDDNGEVHGDPPPTETLGIRWTATHNMFWNSADVARREWNAQRAVDEDIADRELCQYVWSLPYESKNVTADRLDINELIKRTTNNPRGVVPRGTAALTLGIDMGKYLCHWTLTAWREGATGHVVDYGRIDVPSREFPVEVAILKALRDFRDDMIEPGWPVGDADAQSRMAPKRVLIDARYQGDTANEYPVYLFTIESGERYLPALGYGATQQQARRYTKPTELGPKVATIGVGYHVARLRHPRTRVVHIDADHWKTFLRQRLQTPPGIDGALMFYAGAPSEHLGLARHLAAEHPVSEFVPGKGTVTRWLQVSRQNHWLDSTSLSCVAGHMSGARLIDVKTTRPGSDDKRWRDSDKWRGAKGWRS